ncbi:MAG TPA: imelysin family protein, partial [Thermodesulfobacteriota bacterium]
EGGEGGGVPSSYKLNLADESALDYDARPQIETYAKVVHATYRAAHEAALRMKARIDAFLAKPSAETLAEARFAWINARVPYMQTEAFRFYDGPIDVADPETGAPGPEGRINAWPLNEGFIDYTKGNPRGGIVNDRRVPITRAALLERDQVTDEADVTTGWHAIEFLLWGQDLSPTGPGNRPASDYVPGKPANDRRRQYLRVVTDLLVDDLGALVAAWEPGKPDNYAARFLALDQREALGRMFAGIATLAGFELASERIAVGLDSGDQEDEHSCFSDNTRADHIYNLRGIRNVYFGAYGDTAGAGLDRLVESVDPALNARIVRLLNRAEAALIAIEHPYDRVLTSPKDSVARRTAEAAVDALRELAEAFKEAGRKLGVLVVVASE